MGSLEPAAAKPRIWRDHSLWRCVVTAPVDERGAREVPQRMGVGHTPQRAYQDWQAHEAQRVAPP